jgi:FtsZ-binding cell division protein ZapB
MILQTVSISPGCLQLFLADKENCQQTNKGLVPLDLGKLEPTHLVSKNGELIEFRKKSTVSAPSKPDDTGIRPPAKKSRGLRRFCGLTKRGSRRRIGDVEVKQQPPIPEQPPKKTLSTIESVINFRLGCSSHHQGISSQDGRRCPIHQHTGSPPLDEEEKWRTTSTVDHDPSDIATAAVAIQAIVRGWILRKRVGIGMGAKQASMIQAAMRGFLCRYQFKKRLLLRKLQLCYQRKRAELKSIESFKYREMLKFRASLNERIEHLEQTWRRNSEVIGSLMPELRQAREENASMTSEVAELQQDNKSLVLENSRTLVTAAHEEKKVFRLGHVLLQLQALARDYETALSLGRTLLRDFDLMSGFRLEQASRAKDKRSQIARMLELGEEVDVQLC